MIILIYLSHSYAVVKSSYNMSTPTKYNKEINHSMVKKFEFIH